MRKRGLRSFILTHEEAATQNLFEIVQRYHNNCPAHLAPHTGASNANELNFDEIGTAGTKAVGRSSTIQLFHGSEVAFWPFADTHADGVLQAVPNEDNTEIILESTANGIGNFFHQTWRDAEAGKNDYIAIFVPWYWSEEYRRAGLIPRIKSGEPPLPRCHGPTRSANMRRSMGSTMSSSRGGGRRSPSSKMRRCSSRNIQETPPKPSSFPAMTASSRRS